MGISETLRTSATKFNTHCKVVPAFSARCEAAWITGRQHIGLTAGASAPEVLVKQVIARLEELGASSLRALEGIPEHVVFPLPKMLSQ